MKRHISTIHEGLKIVPKRQHPCDICGKSYSARNKLGYHIKAVHKKLKPFECPECSRAFGVLSHMRAHIANVHEGKKPFNCLICDKAFARKTTLNLHVTAVHESHKSFPCEFCGQMFARKEDIKKHINNSKRGLNYPASADGTFECPKCSKSLELVSCLIRKHMDSHEDEMKSELVIEEKACVLNDPGLSLIHI